jgi:asparagine synthase (glutamine-hydrolysing)
MKEAETLSRLLGDSVAGLVGDSDVVAVPFSGGIDSSVIAHLARRHSEVRLYTCGLEYSHDLKMARKASKLMSLLLNEIIIDKDDVLMAIPEVERILETKDPAKVTIALPLYLTTKGVKEEVMLVGQGADELFGGYARYTKMERKELERSLARDFEDLICDDVLGWVKIAAEFSKEVKFPYLGREVVNMALCIPSRLKVREGERKIVLRAAAEKMMIPMEISAAPKKAAQFGTGIAPLINKLAKKRGQNLKEFFEKGGKD